MNNNSNSLFPFVTTVYDLKGGEMAKVVTEYSEGGFSYGESGKPWKTSVYLSTYYPYLTPPEKKDLQFPEKRRRFFTDYDDALKCHFECISLYSVIPSCPWLLSGGDEDVKYTLRRDRMKKYLMQSQEWLGYHEYRTAITIVEEDWMKSNDFLTESGFCSDGRYSYWWIPIDEDGKVKVSDLKELCPGLFEDFVYLPEPEDDLEGYF